MLLTISDTVSDREKGTALEQSPDCRHHRDLWDWDWSRLAMTFSRDCDGYYTQVQDHPTFVLKAHPALLHEY